MRPSFLSLMRGADGRRLAFVLAAVLFVSGLIGGVGAGAAAGMAGDGLVICSADTPAGSGTPAKLPADHGIDCCLVGHASAPVAMPATIADVTGAIAERDAARPETTTNGVILRRLLASEGPRGPPLLS